MREQDALFDIHVRLKIVAKVIGLDLIIVMVSSLIKNIIVLEILQTNTIVILNRECMSQAFCLRQLDCSFY